MFDVTAGQQPRSSWRDRAACDTSGLMAVDPTTATAIAEAFFSLDDGSRELAKQVCDGCSVRSQCLTEAITAGYDDGVWGGLEPEERRAMRAASAGDRGAVA